MTRFPGALALLPLAAILLAGCSSSEPDAPAEAAPPVVSTTPGGDPGAVPGTDEPVYYTPGEDPIVGEMPDSGASPGAMVDVPAGTILPDRPGALPGSLHAFPLKDGAFVVVDPAAPLPNRVAGEVLDRAAGTLPIVTRPGDEKAELDNHRALEEFSTWVEDGTGKPVVVIKSGPAQAAADGGPPVPVWTAWLRDQGTGASASFTQYSVADARSEAEKWIREHGGNPAEYVFVAL